MKAIILSDIHGSAIAARAALQHFENFHCDKIFLLGDTLYHGPRNPLPEGHGPMGVVEALAPYKEKIVAVRGNCDADVDLMMLDFPISDEFTVVEDSIKTADGSARTIRLFLSHGHIFMPECFPKSALDCIESNSGCTKKTSGVANASGATAGMDENRDVQAYLYGHTHIWKIEKNFKDVLLVNPGSTSLPKGGNPPTFGIYESFDNADSKGPVAKFSIHKLEDGSEIASINLEESSG